MQELNRNLNEMIQTSDSKQFSPPKVYYIELTNVCNLRCSMCNFHSAKIVSGKTRQKGFMDFELVKNLMEQIGSFEGDAMVVFHGAGESLLHKDLISIFRYADKFKNIKYGLLTNGMLLDKRLSHEILDTGISWIGFSLDGIDKEKFERYRLGSDFERIMENVAYFLDMKAMAGKKIGVKVNMTLQDEMKEDVDRFIDLWIGKVDEVLISPYKPIGSRESSLVAKGTERVPCYMLYEMLLVYWDGKVGLCCEDWYNTVRLGDVTSEKISNIWNGRIFNTIRRLHEDRKFDRLLLCRDCDSWHNSLPEEYFDEKRNCRVRKNAWQHTYIKA